MVPRPFINNYKLQMQAMKLITSKVFRNIGMPGTVVRAIHALVPLCLLGCTRAEEMSILTNYYASDTPNIFDLSEWTKDVFKDSADSSANKVASVKLLKPAKVLEIFFSASASSNPPTVSARVTDGECMSFKGNSGFYSGECYA